MMNYKTLVAASVMSIVLTSSAFAQCVDCAMYPNRDYLNNGAPTPAARMSQPGPGGAARSNFRSSENSANTSNNARAEMREQRVRKPGRAHHLDSNR